MEGGAVALKRIYSRSDAHPDRVPVVVVIVVPNEEEASRPPAAYTSKPPVLAGAECMRAGADESDMGSTIRSPLRRCQ